MPTYTDAYSGRPNYSLRATVSVHSQDTVNNRSRFNVRLYIRHDSGGGGTYAYVMRPYEVAVGSWSVSGEANFLLGVGSDPIGKEQTIWSGVTGWVDHEPDGSLTASVSGEHLMGGHIGDAALSGSYVVPTIARNLLRVGVEDEWVMAEAFVGVNGVWVPAQPRVGVDDDWVLLDNAA